MKEINVGLIGFGGGGKYFHAPVIDSVPGLNIYKVYATKAENLQYLKDTYKDIMDVTDVGDIIHDQHIQLVVVATPNATHYEIAKKALNCGKHVIVEKPFTVTTEEAEELIALAKSKGLLLTVYHNRRWDSDFRTVQRVAGSSILGEIVSYEAHFDRFKPGFKHNWKEKNEPGSGTLYDLGSHLIDHALCLFGLPQQIFADLEIQKQGGQIADYFKLIMKYPNLDVSLRAGSLVREPGPRYSLHGTKGSYVKYGVDVQEAALNSGLIPRNIREWGKEPEEIWGRINTEVDGLHVTGKIESEKGDYREFYKNVYEAVLGRAELAVKPEEARDVIRIIELAEQSNLEKRWIEL